MNWKVDRWLMAVPIVASVGFAITTYVLKDVGELNFFHLLFRFGLPTLMMMPFLFKYGEEYRKHYI